MKKGLDSLLQGLVNQEATPAEDPNQMVLYVDQDNVMRIDYREIGD